MKHVTAEIPGCFKTLTEKLEHINQSRNSIGSKLIADTMKAVKEGLHDDRLGGQPEKYYGCLSEAGADFLYMGISRMVALAPQLRQLKDNVTLASAHPGISDIMTQEFKDKLALLTEDTGSRMILADLVVPWPSIFFWGQVVSRTFFQARGLVG